MTDDDDDDDDNDDEEPDQVLRNQDKTSTVDRSRYPGDSCLKVSGHLHTPLVFTTKGNMFQKCLMTESAVIRSRTLALQCSPSCHLDLVSLQARNMYQ